MESLRRGLRNDRAVHLDVAALEMAAIESPKIDVLFYTGLLDTFARHIAGRLPPGADGPAYVRAINRYLFDEIGLKGNENDYYNPKNSCLNAVLERQLGIPITLSLIYMEVARRLGKKVHGIGRPGHFIIEFRDENYSAFLDPFHGGREIAAEPAWEPASHAEILARMLNNLRGAYFRAGDFSKAVEALDLLIEAAPQAAAYYKERGVARLQLRRLTAANSDFQAYLKRAPDASDRAEITTQMEAIQRWLAALN